MPRYCFQLQVRPERMAEYRERHRAVWPEMLDGRPDEGFRLLEETGGRWPTRRSTSARKRRPAPG